MTLLSRNGGSEGQQTDLEVVTLVPNITNEAPQIQGSAPAISVDQSLRIALGLMDLRLSRRLEQNCMTRSCVCSNLMRDGYRDGNRGELWRTLANVGERRRTKPASVKYIADVRER